MADGPPATALTGEALEGFHRALLEDDAEALYEQAPCGYLSTTPEGTIVKVNRTFLTLTGYSRTELVGRRTFSELLTAGGRIYHETHLAPMLRMQGSAREIALEVVCADGRRLPVLVNSVLERDEGDGPVVVRTAVFDASDRRRYEQELLRAKERAEASEARAVLLAQTLQQTLIPPAPPSIPGLDVAAVYRPAGDGSEVGGDFYDVFQIGPDDWVAVVGDVRGKGVDAAVVTAAARYTIRAAVVRFEAPHQALAALNEVLLHEGSERFCTVALVRLRRREGTWHATVGVAGHPLPLVVRPPSLPAPLGTPGSLLGVLPDPSFADVEARLATGDVLVLYTDGVTEARAGREFYDEARMREVVAANVGSAGAAIDALLGDVLAFQSGSARDDIAIVVLRVP